MPWNTTLLCCALLLVFPRYGLQPRYHVLANGTIFVSIVYLCFLHAYITEKWFLICPLMLLGLHLQSAAAAARPMQWLWSMLHGGVIAIFARQFERLYPFLDWRGVPMALVEAVVITVLFVVFARGISTLWLTWPCSFLYIAILNMRHDDYFTQMNDWFWSIELWLHVAFAIVDFIRSRRSDSRTVV